jgi:hypothetical protein
MVEKQTSYPFLRNPSVWRKRVMTGIRISAAVERLWLPTAVTILAACLTQVQSAPQEPEKLPQGVSRITKENLLTRVPNFFCFEYDAEPQPGKRLWLRVDDKHWVERYPDGLESKFKIVGRMKVKGENGTVVAKIAGDPVKTNTPNDGTFYVFIPDKGNVEMVIRVSRARVNQLAGGWTSSEMEKIE